MAQNRIYLYPVWVRLWHIINALMCLILIITGVSMQYSTQDNAFIGFQTAVKWHNVAGILLLTNYFVFLIGNIVTTNKKHYMLIYKGFINRLIKQFRYYTFGMFKRESAPFEIDENQKFNPIQQIAYIIIMYGFVPLVCITGCIMFYPEDMVNQHGFLMVDILHVIGGFTISLFLIIHLYFSTIGHNVSSHFKSMFNGWHEGY